MIMEIKWGNYSVESLKLGKKTIGRKFGFETSTSYSFFTMAENNSHRIKIKNKKIKQQKNKNVGSLEIDMIKGKIQLTYNEEIKNNVLERKYKIKTLEESNLFDIVQRFRFEKNAIDFVKIGSEKIKHTNSNINHMYQKRKVQIMLKNKKMIEISAKKNNSKDFENFVYARDTNKEWIVHFRLLPKKPYEKIIMINYPNWDIPLPNPISKLLFLSKTIEKILWYKGERKEKIPILRKLRINAYACKKVKKGVEININTKLKVCKWEK